MRQVVVRSECDADDVVRLTEPRDDIAHEREIGPGRYEAERSPFRFYQRTVETEPLADGRVAVTQTTDFDIAAGPWTPLFRVGYRLAIKRPRPDGRAPWWAPPDMFDAEAALVLGLLCSLSVIAGYLGTLISQTMTYAADEFGADKGSQGAALAAVRIGVILSVAVTAVADRKGRRTALLLATIGGCLATIVTAFAPSLLGFTIMQTVARGFATALILLLAVVAAEEVPAGSRAYAVSLLSMSGALGAGLAVALLFVADAGVHTWRLLFLVPVVFVLLIREVQRDLPETRRYKVQHAEATFAGHGRRFWLLAISGFLLAVFTAPASQFMNEFLRDEHNYSGARISAFTIVTNTPGALGIVIGGHLADVRGRRLIGSIAIGGGTALTVAMFFASGAALWGWSALGAIIGAAAVPALGVYGPELFPTSLRGRANGIITVFAVAGSSTGLLMAGWLADRYDRFGPAMTIMAIGPAVLAVLIIVAYPETAHRELEDINPEDRAAATNAPIVDR